MSSDSDKVKKLLQSARSQMQQGAREEALRLLRDAQRIDPSNAEISERISSIEREIAAMEKFNRTRSSRAHTAGRTISSTGFVEDCLRRSGEAFEAGDEVRALQELERARRHDPDNDEVRRRIRHVRRSVKVNSLAPALLKFNEDDDADYRERALSKNLIPREGGFEELQHAVDYLFSS